MTTVAAKRYATVQKRLEFFPKAYSSCQSIGNGGNGHSFLVGGGRRIISPRISKTALRKLPQVVLYHFCRSGLHHSR